MKVFVTGVNGFLGRAFCKVATAAGHDILGLSRSAPDQLPARGRAMRGSLNEIAWREVERFAPDAVLHLAWVATPGVYLHSDENKELLTQSEHLFAGFIKRGIGYVAGVGTCIEYAPSALPLLEETSPLAPGSPYAVSKVETCHRLRSLAEEAGTGWSWLRVFYPYGEGEHRDRLPSTLMRRVAAGETLELKTPDSIKDYIHAHDVARAMLVALEQRLVGPVNIGTGQGMRIEELARAIVRCCGGDMAQVRRAAEPASDPFPVCVADTQKLRAANWRPRITMEEGLARLWESLSHQG